MSRSKYPRYIQIKMDNSLFNKIEKAKSERRISNRAEWIREILSKEINIVLSENHG